MFAYNKIRGISAHLTTAAGSSVWPLLVLTLVLGGCDARPRYHIDGGLQPDVAILPDGLPQSDATGELFAGMTISGCAEQTLTDEILICRGTVPLSLGFASLAPPNASTFKWEFGDQTPDGESPSTSHAYQSPGTYTVLLVVGGPFGTISPPYLTQVEVEPVDVGAFCDSDDQCVDGLCLCATADARG